ncbi:MAG: hypothetical protein KGM42_00825 [Hyphomicrobiales bacterium]|nr:hypothetical protein [Hyphomicrobiales bacterium]
MSKQHKHLSKVVEKFRRNAEKELDRVTSLAKKAEKLKSGSEPSSGADRFFERLRQKELQASGEIAWAGQFLNELASARDKSEKSKKSAGVVVS